MSARSRHCEIEQSLVGADLADGACSRAVRRGTRLGVLLFLSCLALSIARPLPVGADEPAGDDVAVEERYQPRARGGRAVVEELAAQHFQPYRIPWAVRTARCETGGTFDLYAHSSGFDRRLGVWFEFWGPWQVDAVTWRAKAWELFAGSLSEPDVSAAMAAWIVEHVGPRQWPVCGW